MWVEVKNICGVRFRAEPKKRYMSFVVLSLVLTGKVYLGRGLDGWGKWVIGMLLGVAVFVSVLEADRQYERIE